jgi:hypothetical protein
MPKELPLVLRDRIHDLIETNTTLSIVEHKRKSTTIDVDLIEGFTGLVCKGKLSLTVKNGEVIFFLTPAGDLKQ